jgi:N-acetylgalactosamine-6-phosphate deacetylase
LKLKGPDLLLLVSDASSVAGCPPGEYESGGLLVTVHKKGFATSGRGGGWLAGSTITLLTAVQRAVNLAGVSLQNAVHMATLGPARAIGIAANTGHLAPGTRADLLILNKDLSLRQVIIGGQLLTQ